LRVEREHAVMQGKGKGGEVEVQKGEAAEEGERGLVSDRGRRKASSSSRLAIETRRTRTMQLRHPIWSERKRRRRGWVCQWSSESEAVLETAGPGNAETQRTN